MEEAENNSWNIFYRKGMFFSIVGFVGAIFCFLMGWNGWFNYFSDKPEVWFQRSGSIMLVLLVIADYHVYKLNGDVDDLDMTPCHAVKAKDNYRAYVKKLPLIAIVLTLMATAICGYGDLIYSSLK